MVFFIRYRSSFIFLKSVFFALERSYAPKLKKPQKSKTVGATLTQKASLIPGIIPAIIYIV